METKKLTPLEKKLITVISIAVILAVSYFKIKDIYFDKGYSAGLSKGKDSCSKEISKSLESIRKDDERRKTIFSEPPDSAYLRLKQRFGSKGAISN